MLNAFLKVRQWVDARGWRPANLGNIFAPASHPWPVRASERWHPDASGCALHGGHQLWRYRSACATTHGLTFPHLEFSVRLMDYQKYITIEPGKRGGKPCIRGMRITVYEVLDYLASGMSEAEILADFPDLTADDLKACLAFAADRERKLATIPS